MGLSYDVRLLLEPYAGIVPSKITSENHMNVSFNKWIDLTWTVEGKPYFV